MPRGFSYPVGSAQPNEMFAPLAFRAIDRARGGPRNFQFSVIGRIKDGISLAQASDDMKRVAAAVDNAEPRMELVQPGR